MTGMRGGKRWVTALLAVAAVVAAGGAGLRNGSAAPSTKNYSTTITNGSPSVPVAAGATFAATIVLSNAASSSQTLGSENVTLPLGYTAASGAIPIASNASRHWLAVTIGSATLPDGTHSVLQLRAQSSGDAIAPTETVSVTVNVSTPCQTPLDLTWRTEAKQSNAFNGPPGNDFLSTTGTYEPSTGLYKLQPFTASGSGCKFVFGAIGTPQQAGKAFAVSIQAQDGSGHLQTGYSGTATLSSTLSDSPNGSAPTVTQNSATTGFPASVTFVGGQASVSVKAVDTQSGASFSITDGSLSGSSANNPIDVVPGDPAALAFGTEPTDTTVGAAISPAVTVDVYDAFGNLESCATCAQVGVTLSIANDAAYDPPYNTTATQLGGAGPVTSVAGTAAFPGVALDQSGVGFTLQGSATYSSNPFSSPVSSSFNVFDSVCSPATPYSTCTAQKNGAQVTTDYPTPTTDDTSFQMTASGLAFNCSGAQQSIGPIISYTPAQQDVNGHVYTYTNPISITFRWTKALVPGTGVANFTLCLAKPFAADGGYWQPGVYRVVQNCPTKLTAKTILPCASQRKRNNAGDLIIVLLAGSGDPGAGLH